jgi:hypothetical protein
MDASLAVTLLPGMACMQKMQEQFSVQNGLIFGEPQATQIGLAFFAPLFWPRTTARDGGSTGNAGAIPSEKGLARLLGRHYEARKARACETTIRNVRC